MNILLDNLSSLKKYENIDTNFRCAIMFEILMQDRDITKKDKILKTLQLFYKDTTQIEDIEQAINLVLDFYTKEKNEEDSEKNGCKSSKDRIFSYEYDADYIYSAFMQQYNINLQQIKYLHWWEFKALFNSLSDQTKFMKIIEYRTVNIAKIKDKKRKKFYKEMKKLYALPDMRTEEEKESDFANELW